MESLAKNMTLLIVFPIIVAIATLILAAIFNRWWANYCKKQDQWHAQILDHHCKIDATVSTMMRMNGQAALFTEIYTQEYEKIKSHEGVS
jgi:uncharacterized membrane-anchored protein YhcB (DUF1043 family)